MRNSIESAIPTSSFLCEYNESGIAVTNPPRTERMELIAFCCNPVLSSLAFSSPTCCNTTVLSPVVHPRAYRRTSSSSASRVPTPSSPTFSPCPNRVPTWSAASKLAGSNVPPDFWVLPRLGCSGFASPSCKATPPLALFGGFVADAGLL